MTEQRVTIHTDVACSGNPGPGGWGAILTFGDHEKELNGGEPHTTNNRMELMAAISALETLKRPCSVDLYTEIDRARTFQGFQRGDRRHQFHAVVGGVRLAAVQFLFVVAES